MSVAAHIGVPPASVPSASAPSQDTHAARSYLLRLDPKGDGVRATLNRRGLPDVTHFMRGRTIDEATRFAGLLFPLCPRAHQAAFLRSVEAALDVELSVAQSTARQIAVLAEAAAAGVWREALVWPSLVGRAPNAAAVRAARGASDAILRALYADDWARVGGATDVR